MKVQTKTMTSIQIRKDAQMGDVTVAVGFFPRNERIASLPLHFHGPAFNSPSERSLNLVTTESAHCAHIKDFGLILDGKSFSIAKPILCDLWRAIHLFARKGRSNSKPGRMCDLGRVLRTSQWRIFGLDLSILCSRLMDRLKLLDSPPIEFAARQRAHWLEHLGQSKSLRRDFPLCCASSLG
jgi:hypothetical protein